MSAAFSVFLRKLLTILNKQLQTISSVKSQLRTMPKPKGCQHSGAKKRNLAKEKADKARSKTASAPRPDRYLVHSTVTTQSESQSAASEPILLQVQANLTITNRQTQKMANNCSHSLSRSMVRKIVQFTGHIFEFIDDYY